MQCCPLEPKMTANHAIRPILEADVAMLAVDEGSVQAWRLPSACTGCPADPVEVTHAAAGPPACCLLGRNDGPSRDRTGHRNCIRTSLARRHTDRKSTRLNSS